MPCWTIHTAIAKDLNKELNLNPDLLYYGAILPDVDKIISMVNLKLIFI